MALTRENARDEIQSLHKDPKVVFGDKAENITDVTETDGGLLCVCGLPFYAPICLALENDEVISRYLSEYRGCDNLFSFSKGSVRHFSGRDEISLPKEISERLIGLASAVVCARGEIGDEGEHIIDLKTPKIGCHYDINLLLGNRTDFPSPMMTTPKSAVDSLGRGSFRAGAAKQVLATRYTLNPEENGDPANRQFYIYEDGRQIFYSANVRENVKTAVCRHMRNRTVIEYETECGLKIKRTIFILPQDNGMPEATEA